MLHQVTTLFLDMDGTLLDLNFDYRFWNEHLPRRYGEIHGLDPDAAVRHVSEALRNAEGSLSWYCTDHWSDRFDVDIMALKTELNHLVEYRAGAKQFLEGLSELPVRVILLTNAHPDVLALKQELTDLLQYFDDSYTSHDFGHAKEDRQFWASLQQHCDYDRDASLMVDDSVKVLTAARQFGTSHQLCITHPDSNRGPIDPGPFVGINELSSMTTGIHS